MRARLITPAAIILLGLSACSGNTGFEDSDPEAHQACTKFLVEPSLENVAPDEMFIVTMGTVLIVGEHASKAATPEIRATAEELPGLDQWVIDDDALITACTEAGYEVNDQSVAAHYLAQ